MVPQIIRKLTWHWRKNRADITEIWKRSHAHLRPLSQELAFTNCEWEYCRLCGKCHAISIKANLRFGEKWHNNKIVLYCYACQHYSLFEAEQNNTALTSVDARLWFRTPVILQLEPSTRCNFNCWYCIGRSMEQADIGVDDFVHALDHFPTLKTLVFMGEGEPLLHKDFFHMVKMARDRNIHVITVSNASMFNKHIIKKICESGITYLAISVDSADAKTFAKSRVGGNLNKIWQGVENLAKYRDEQGYKYPVIGLKGTLLEPDKNEIPAIIKEAKRRKVDVLESFQSLNPMPVYIKSYPKDKLDLLKDFAQVQKTINFGHQQSSLKVSDRLPSAYEFMYRENICISDIGNPNSIRKNCDKEWIHALVSGEITPCCQIKTPLSKELNIFEHPITDILHNEDYENIKFNLWNGIFLHECKGCGLQL